MPNYSLTDDLNFALALAGEADLISLDRYQAANLDIQLKADKTHVTDADKRVETVLREQIAESRPGDALFGEEFGVEGDSSRQWIIDPIDGTANFLRGVPIWGTLISLAVDGIPVVGVVSAPALGKRWWAARGQGAWVRSGSQQPQRIAVSTVATLAEANISYNRLQGWDEIGRLDQVIALTRAVWRERGIGDMWSYMLLAEGALDLVGEPDLKPYDMAALIPIIEEAGGTFTSIDGEAGPWHGSALATNGLLHEAALAALSE
ncbi:inositol monophosphatase family protein [Salinibacterium sp. ZJ450]|uniref:inositol monophosphatase family protein n=1 Tax=Salinibacterium sp. ZJ450 TaxID=2708338 RepID=UPI001CD6B942|nr:inositol monophosphatase family protein [Salinibacterium sp. ZJ450]